MTLKRPIHLYEEDDSTRELREEYRKKYYDLTDEEKERAFTKNTPEKDVKNVVFDVVEYKQRLAKFSEEVEHLQDMIDASLRIDDEKYVKDKVRWIKEEVQNLSERSQELL